jgi:H+/Cl- antiporter ClcA
MRSAALAQRIGLAAVVGVACGAASALFLFLLDEATGYREAHAHLVYALPLAGLGLGLLHARFGHSIKAGNNLVIDTIHDAGPELPFRMLPMVMIGTVWTHLFGGSAGREGAAVQMGASLADYLSHRARLRAELRGQLLAAGVAAGFGSVFGTPIAGAIFGLELVVPGRLKHDALVPALVASVVGDLTTRQLGIVHTAYPAAPWLELSPLLTLRWLVFAAAVALVSVVFIELTHALKQFGERRVAHLGVRMAIGGAIVVVMWLLIGTSDYLGLGIPTIVRAFTDPQLPAWAFAAKLAFTAITLGAGFLGGEVTPLFFIGATLGGVLGPALGIPRELGAGVGMAALFASASKTPLALSVMAVELLGAHVLPHVALVALVAYRLSGHRSIYPAQRMLRPAPDGGPATAVRIRDLSTTTAPQRAAHE